MKWLYVMNVKHYSPVASLINLTLLVSLPQQNSYPDPLPIL